MLLTDFDIHLTENLYTQWKTLEGARVMLTYNINLEVRLINELTGTLVLLQMPRDSYRLHGTIYVKFEY